MDEERYRERNQTVRNAELTTIPGQFITAWNTHVDRLFVIP